MHPGLAGDGHLGPRGAGGPDRAGVRPQRGAHQGPFHDRAGGRHQPLVPLRHHLPGVPGADHHDRLPGRQRRRLGALRGPGEGTPPHRLPASRLRVRLAAAHPAHGRHLLLVSQLRPVALRGLRGGRAGLPAGQGRAQGQDVRRLSGAGRAAGLDARTPRLRPQSPRSGGRGRGAGPPGGRSHRGRTEGGPAAVRRREPRRAGELPAGADGVAGEPAGFLRQGQRVLPAAPAGRGRGRPLR